MLLKRFCHKNKNQRQSSGFTIVELIVVIIIIGILAAITVVSFSGIVKKSKESALVSDMSNARKKLEMDKIQRGQYPTTNYCDANNQDNPSVSDDICLPTSPDNTFYYESDGKTYNLEGFINDNNEESYTATETEPAIKQTGWKSISAGNLFTCGIRYGGRAYCWGVGTNGVLGDNTSTTRTTPTLINSETGARGLLDGKPVIDLAVGINHTCAINSIGKVYCWGKNDYGTPISALGNGSFNSKPNPTLINSATGARGLLDDKPAISISAGLAVTCAISSEGKAYCWGSNTNSQLGYSGPGTSRPTILGGSDGYLDGKPVKAISIGSVTASGWGHVCAIDSEGKAYCWGGNAYEQLVDGTTTRSDKPKLINSNGYLDNYPVTSISNGYANTCVINSVGETSCVGYGTPSGLLSASGGQYSQFSMKYQHHCEIDSAGKAYCQGNNGVGQLGNGNNINKGTPTPITDGSSGLLDGKTVKSISVGYGASSHTCAIASDNQAYCWGLGSSGQLGRGDLASSNVPVNVNNP